MIYHFIEVPLLEELLAGLYIFLGRVVFTPLLFRNDVCISGVPVV
jgi:hypothetical protein